MPPSKLIEVEKKYAFPLFTKPANSIPLAGNEKLVISDIWAFWDYIVKKFSFEKSFMTSLLEQAKYFYSAADNSPTKSQPLLYYYALLNFSKLLINIDKRYGKAGGLYHHGIKEINNNKFSLSTIEVEIKKSNIKNVAAELAESLDGILIAHKLTIKIKDLLAHCVGIHRTYCELYNQNESFCKLGKMSLLKQGRQLTLKAPIQANSSKVAALRSVGYNIVSSEASFYWSESFTLSSSSLTRKDYYEFSQQLRSKGIWYYIASNGYTNYLSLNPNNRYPPEIIIYYTMFYLGSITRYHPYLFDDLFSDKEQWLMSEFLKTQPKQFLYLSTAKILGQGVHKAYSSF